MPGLGTSPAGTAPPAQGCIGVADAARYLGVPVETLRSWLRRGVLPSFRIGGRRLLDLADLEAAIKAAKRLEA